MASSAVVSVKRALRDLLQARPNLAGKQIEYGVPDVDTLERERIFLGRARFPQNPGSMRAGRVHRKETGELDVYCDADVVGGDQEAADEAAIALGLEVEECVADNPGLGNDPDNGILVGAVTMRRGELISGVSERGSVSRITYTLQWDAELH